ncbi:MAG TPA: hypothetical protein VD969_26470 [Symbiobacteriaceae bacterium]|nr:hypothetical protein [Symbiobacteriaceae bacterium]
MSKNEPEQAQNVLNTKPSPVPLIAIPANTAEALAKTRSMNDPTMLVITAASALLSTLAAGMIAAAATDNNLGTPRPSEGMVGTDQSNTYMYIVPVKPNTPGATEIKYRKSGASINLYPLFSKLDRLVPKGIREYYDVKPTPGEVTIGNVKGWGVYIDLTDFSKEAVSRLSEEEKARRNAKRRQTIAAKKAAKESAPATEETAE